MTANARKDLETVKETTTNMGYTQFEVPVLTKEVIKQIDDQAEESKSWQQSQDRFDKVMWRIDDILDKLEDRLRMLSSTIEATYSEKLSLEVLMEIHIKETSKKIEKQAISMGMQPLTYRISDYLAFNTAYMSTV